MTGLPLDHVAIAVPSMTQAIPMHEALSGRAAGPVETLETQGVRVAFVGGVELLEPLSADTPVGRFLSRHGPGLHHLAYRTADLDAELARLVGLGFEPIDRTGRIGARGHRVAFLHPAGTGKVLIELVQP
ncbi:MAG: methylmalonyl-CoA epimerase [Gemmatimonadetes bacterium]|nr:methylmalonyl-CoA epimerase [Gemmatimonadota bacterium]